MALVFKEHEVDGETFEFKLNGKIIASVNHDEHGWVGIDLIRQTIKRIEQIANAPERKPKPKSKS